MSRVVQFAFGGFIALLFLLQIGELIEAELTTPTITNEMTLAFLGVVEWGIPVAGIAAIIFVGLRLMRQD